MNEVLIWRGLKYKKKDKLNEYLYQNIFYAKDQRNMTDTCLFSSTGVSSVVHHNF
jgi:hypothetical protein